MFLYDAYSPCICIHWGSRLCLVPYSVVVRRGAPS